MQMRQTRRGFLTSASMALGATLLAAPPAAAEETLETTSLRLIKSSSICSAPQYVAEELLRAEGFTDIRYIAGTSAEVVDAVARNRVDFNMHYGSVWVSAIDDGAPVTILAGVHVGCFALFVQNGIDSVVDLKGRSIAFSGGMGSSQQLFAAMIVARVGLDPAKDIRWVASSSPKLVDLFADRKVDALLGVPRRRRKRIPADWAVFSSTAHSTTRGRNIFAACGPATAILSGPIRSQRSECCAQS